MRLAPLVVLLTACGSDLPPEDSGSLPQDTASDPAPPTDSDDPDDSDAPPDPQDTDSTPSTQFSVDVAWTGASPSSSVKVTVHDPLGRTSWRFGLAETEAGAGGWYGEDCYLGTGAYALCHPFTGTSLDLDQASSPSQIVEGSSTLLWTGMELTYYLEDDAGSCWVWGHDPSYYASLGCTALGPGNTTVVRRHDCGGFDPADPAPLGGKVALSFDDGPHLTVTPQILATLRAKNVPATFFMLGENIAPTSAWSLVEEIRDDPLFDIGNHTWDHASMSLLGESDARDEIVDTNDLLDSFGVSPKFFRFPYGDSTCFTADIVRDDYGHRIAGWQVDTADWCYASGGSCSRSEYWRVPPAYKTNMIGYTVDQLEDFDGGVVLLHDIHQHTADKLGALIDAIRAKGFTFTRLTDLGAFPRLNAGNPYDFPWVGESCNPSADTCWQIEWEAWCEPTDVPGKGVCVLPCTGSMRCTDRSGNAPLFCAEVSQTDDFCLGESSPLNRSCADVPGTVAVSRSAGSGSGSEVVCEPKPW